MPAAHDQGKQVVVEDAGKHVVSYSDHEARLEAINVQEYTNCKDQEYQEPPVYQEQKTQRSRKWIVLGVVGLLVVILAVVLGGVLWSKKGTSSSKSGTPTTSLQQYNIAAIAFDSDAVNSTRVYYSNNGSILEAANSASDTTWTFKSIADLTNRESSLAAAVSRPNFPLEISVYYTDENYLIHDIIYNSTSSQWAEGTVSDEKYTTHPNSSLAAMYHQCLLCANTTILAYQDVNGFVQVANQTSSGWTLTQLKIDSYTGTGLALQPFYRAGIEDQINLYYQTADLNITLASLDPRLTTTEVDGWSDITQSYNVGVPGTPLAAASAYTNVTTGYESWIQLLQLSDAGIETNSWSGNLNHWLDQYNHPSAMANSTINVRTYSDIAVTAIGGAYAVVTSAGNTSIEAWQVSDNLIEWTSTGTVVSLSS